MTDKNNDSVRFYSSFSQLIRQGYLTFLGTQLHVFLINILQCRSGKSRKPMVKQWPDLFERHKAIPCIDNVEDGQHRRGSNSYVSCTRRQNGPSGGQPQRSDVEQSELLIKITSFRKLI